MLLDPGSRAGVDGTVGLVQLVGSILLLGFESFLITAWLNEEVLNCDESTLGICKVHQIMLSDFSNHAAIFVCFARRINPLTFAFFYLSTLSTYYLFQLQRGR